MLHIPERQFPATSLQQKRHGDDDSWNRKGAEWERWWCEGFGENRLVLEWEWHPGTKLSWHSNGLTPHASQCQVSWATAGVVTRGESMCFGTRGAGSLWRGPTYLAPRPHSCNGPFSWRIVGDSPSWYGRRRPSIWCTMPCCASSIIARNWSGHLPQRRRHYILCNV